MTPQNRNFCERCGKRFGSNEWDIHTCTPPPQHKPLTDEHPLMVFAKECVLGAYQDTELADAAKRAIKAAQGIKENT